MTRAQVIRTEADVRRLRARGDHEDSRRAGWAAINAGSAVLREIQDLARSKPQWKSLDDARGSVNGPARKILKMRLEAIHSIKHAPHHRDGFRPSRHTGRRNSRGVTALCLISGHEGQEIPGLVGYDRVVVDAEHMEQALGPASLTEIFRIRKRIGESVYISTNVSETPQVVRSIHTGDVDIRATSALTASKVIAALSAGADVVKVGFANLDAFKRDLKGDGVLQQMKLVRQHVDDVVRERLIVMRPSGPGQYPLISVFFPEIGIDAYGERPMDIARKGIDLTARAGWQGILLDTFEKYTHKAYGDFYTLKETAALAQRAHEKGLEFWIAGSIQCPQVPELLRCGVDLICFGGAARHRGGKRVKTLKGGKPDESIKRDLVEELVRTFEKSDPRR